MKVYSDMSLYAFDAWAGAIDTKQRILDKDKEEEFECLIEELYPDGIDETQLNDILWFETDWLFEYLGIKHENDEEEYNDEEE